MCALSSNCEERDGDVAQMVKRTRSEVCKDISDSTRSTLMHRFSSEPELTRFEPAQWAGGPPGNSGVESIFLSCSRNKPHTLLLVSPQILWCWLLIHPTTFGGPETAALACIWAERTRFCEEALSTVWTRLLFWTRQQV